MAGPAECNIGRGDSPGPIGGREDYVGTGNLAVPVKSMAGESLKSADITQHGIAGDRIIQVRNTSGRILTARTRPGLLSHRAMLVEDGSVLVDDRPWNTPEVASEVAEAAGAGTHLVRSDAEDRFDILPLLVTTDGMFSSVGYDRRRFRPNLVIGGVKGLTERQWEGGYLRIGEAVIGMEDLRDRCIMTTFDPDTGEQNLDVLRRIQKEFDGVTAVGTGESTSAAVLVTMENVASAAAHTARHVCPLHTFVDEPLSLRTGAIVPGNGVSLFEESGDHIAAQYSESDKPKIRHY